MMEPRYAYADESGDPNHGDRHWFDVISAQIVVLWHERFEQSGKKKNSPD